MRNLATVQTIKALEPIPNKDKILYASFENVGFRVIVGTDMKVGDKVIYCEADSLLPVLPEFEFLRSRCFNDKWNGFRIRNMKMAGLYSEGIVFPMSTLYSIHPNIAAPDYKWKDGEDLTTYLSIVKYDPEALEEKKLAQKKNNKLLNFIYKYQFLTMIYNWIRRTFFQKQSYAWPEWASKSDETRAQSLNYIFEKYQGKEFYATEKLDGQSALFGYVKNKFVVCSRNINLKDPGKGGDKNNYWTYAKAHQVEQTLQRASKDMEISFYIQGELCGPGIQGNKYKFDSAQLFIFNIKDVTHDRYFSVDEVTAFCEKYEFNRVPVLEKFTFQFKDMQELLTYSKGMSLYNKQTPREGVVIRSVAVSQADRGQSNMCSFKVINPEFDLKFSSKD